MKKLLTALALGSAITATAYAQRPQTDRENKGLKGPVKSVLVEIATLEKQGERYVEEGRHQVSKVTYNAEGNFAETESYTRSGAVFTKDVYRYVGGEKIADGQSIIPVVISPHSPAGAPAPLPRNPISRKYKYKYGAKGDVVEMTVEEQGHVIQWAVYKLEGDRKETRWYEAADGHLIGREVDRFDAQGNLAEITRFNVTTGDVIYKYSYTGYKFDARGNWVKRLRVESGGGVPEVRKVEYRTITYF